MNHLIHQRRHEKWAPTHRAAISQQNVLSYRHTLCDPFDASLDWDIPYACTHSPKWRGKPHFLAGKPYLSGVITIGSEQDPAKFLAARPLDAGDPQDLTGTYFKVHINEATFFR